MGRINSLLIAFLISACVTAAPKQRIYRATPLEPEAWFEELYTQVERCAAALGLASGISYAEIEWYVIEHETIPGIAGVFSRPNRIYLDEEFVASEWVVKHELGHAAIVAFHNRHEDAVFKICTTPVE